ncbi:autotransporter domain-containing protein [Oricola sp.]|uniref:autotransporter domain-containing protein n=1 Tax=Oricola sp. TaxID=1979950 RepID=UPI0025DFE47B|nr:autotransporter domain-containing protein [Oricola sp.]MCI5077945.1 autotransporter domain-containing protein [Oricola sp.]
MGTSGNSVTGWQSVSVRRRLHLLLATSALTVVLPVAAVAQEIIDGTSETVVGTGGGTQASPWYVGGLENPTDLTIGSTGTGTLAISAGGVVVDVAATIGDNSGSEGTVTVDGAGSKWTSALDLRVGNSGTGTLNISDGGEVYNDYGIIADEGGSDGTVTVDGPDSVWTNRGKLFVGYGGTGRLHISAGGAVTNDLVAVIGEFGSSIGRVTVDGAGSSWTISDALRVGDFGRAYLDISAGGTVSGTIATIGYSFNSLGTVTVDGAGSSWTNSGSLVVGRFGSGTLDISDSGAVSANGVSVAAYPGSISTINIGAASGEAAVAAGTLDSPTLAFGDGTGTLVFNHTDTGYDFGSDISGNGTILHEAGETNLTGDSSGFLGETHVSGGTLNVRGALGGSIGTIGINSGSNGTVTVEGSESSWTNSDSLYVGEKGRGALEIAAGGAVSNASAYIGYSTGSHGTVTVDGAGSSWTTSDRLHVGDGGTGSLDISSGGTVNANGVSVAVGAGSTGTINIGAASGGPAAAAGTLSSQTMVFGDGDGTLVFNHTDTGYDFGTDISGDGTIFHKAGDTNLSGDSTGFLGETRVYGGTLHVRGSLGGSTGVIGTHPGSNGTVTVEGSASSWTNSGDLFVGNEGTGTLDISDGGTVSNSVGGIGTTSGSNGTVTVEGPDSSWTNSVNLFVGNAGTGTLNISGSGAVNTNLVTVARNAGSTGTINIGAASGEAAVAAGTLNSPIVLFGDGDGTLVFNHTASGHKFGANLSGDGQILQEAGDTILSGDSSGFSGSTSVSGGTLHVNGLLGGTIDVSGGVLGGSGTLGALTADAGAAVAPGNSIGTLNVGDTTFNAGSVYEVELNDGGFVAGINNDLLNASGTVTINGGTVNVTPVNGSDSGISYTLGSYTILTAAGGVVGTFDALTDDYAFLDFALDYSGANSVILNSSLAVSSFCQAGMTANQCATGEGAYSLGFGDATFNALLTLANDEAPGALDQLSGEIYASAKTALLEDSRFPREAAQDRLRFALGGVGADNRGQAFGYGGGGFWAQGFGAWSQQHGNGNVAAIDRSIGGFILGADTLVLDDLHFGVLGGYSRSNFHVDSRASSGTADTYSLGAYAGRTGGAFSLEGGVAYSWHSLDTSRLVGFTGFSDSLTASYSAGTLQVWGEAAYSIEVSTARFEPFANLAFANLSTDGFTESGDAAALTASGQSTSATFTTLGFRGDKQVDLGAVHGTLSGEIGWRHTFGNTPTATQSFAAGGSDFGIAGVPLERDSLVLGAGFDVNLTEGASLGLTYSGQFGSSGQDHSAKAKLTARF